MLDYIEPCGAAVEVIYKCPKCSCEHKLTRKDTQYPGIVVCCCKNRFRIRPIEKVLVKPLYRDINRKNFAAKQQIDTADAVNCLVGLGYKKGEIRPKLAVLMKNKTYNVIDDLIKDFLREEKGNG